MSLVVDQDRVYRKFVRFTVFQRTAAAPVADTVAIRLPQWHPVARGRTERSRNQEESLGAREDDWDDPTLA